MALSGLWLLYDLFLSVFGNTGLTRLDEAAGRTSSTGTPSASAEASTPTVRSRAAAVNEGFTVTCARLH